MVVLSWKHSHLYALDRATVLTYKEHSLSDPTCSHLGESHMGQLRRNRTPTSSRSANTVTDHLHIPTIHFPWICQYGFLKPFISLLFSKLELPKSLRHSPNSLCYLWAHMAPTGYYNINSFLYFYSVAQWTVVYSVPSRQAKGYLSIRCALLHQRSLLFGDPLYHCLVYLAASCCWGLCSRTTFPGSLHYCQWMRAVAPALASNTFGFLFFFFLFWLMHLDFKR